MRKCCPDKWVLHAWLKRAFFLLQVLVLTACGFKVADPIRPNNRVFAHMPAGGNAEYNQGWKEGCESGMTAHTNNFYQSFYIFKQDQNLITHEVYYKAWQDASTYCRLYAYALLKEADLRRRNPNQGQYFASDQPVKGFLQWMTNWGMPFTNRR